MIITGHPWMGAVTFVGVLAASLVHSRIRAGAEAAREREILDYARHANDIGEDPTPVVRALRWVEAGTEAGEERPPPRSREDNLIHYPPRA